ncbi:MAG: hypothetical protein RSD09_07510 [Bacilli bacterium]
MINLANDYASKNPEFNDSVKSLLNQYNKKDIDEEVLADISGQLFGNQEFINNLSMEKPTVFKQVYNKIIEWANKLTGNSKESLFIKDLKNKWESAYKNVNLDSNSNIKHSKAKLENSEDVVISDEKLGKQPNNKKVRSVLEKIVGVKYINKNTENEISIENKDINKFLHDGYNQYKNTNLKKRISSNYGEIIELAKERVNIKNRINYKNSNKGKEGFDYYSVYIAFPKENNYDIYKSRLVVRKEKNGHFAYDLDNFIQKKGLVVDKTSLSILSSGELKDKSFSENNISQSNDNVKSDISNTYSMQEKDNDTQELESKQNKRKRTSKEKI